jgi:hypothetical protein
MARRQGWVAFGMSTAWSLAAAAQTTPEPPLRAVVHVASANEAALLNHIRAQSVDIGATIVTDSNPIEGQLPTQLEMARRLGVQLSARVVVWFGLIDRGGSLSLLIQVADLAERRMLVRQLDVGLAARRSGTQDREAPRWDSATLEAAALIVRTTLRALVAGGSIGVTQDEVVHRSPPTEHVVSDRAGYARQLMPRHDSGRRLLWRGVLGWQAVFDGFAPLGHHGPMAALAMQISQLEVALSAATALPATRTDDRTAVQLSRHSMSASLGLVFCPIRDIELGALFGVGTVFYHRTTSALVAGVTPTPPQMSPSVLLAPELRARWLPSVFDGVVALTLTVGLDVVPGAPELVHQVGRYSLPFYDVAWLQPKVTLGFSLGSRQIGNWH